MAAPELTVIVPTFGRPEKVRRAVMSALSQSVDLEVIVVDDGSPAPITMDLELVTVIRLPENRGPAGARNAGVEAARAPWIAFLDSDDVWTPQSLRGRFDVARGEGDSSRTIWAAGFADTWPNGRQTVRIPKATERVVDFASGCWSCPGSTALLSRAAWDRSGGQDEALRRLEDYDWLFRWGQLGGRLAVHERAAAEINRGARADPDVVRAAAERLRKKHWLAPKPLKRRMESYLQLELAASCLGHAKPREGIAALAKSWVLHPRLQPAVEPFWTSTKR